MGEIEIPPTTSNLFNNLAINPGYMLDPSISPLTSDELLINKVITYRSDTCKPGT